VPGQEQAQGVCVVGEAFGGCWPVLFVGEKGLGLVEEVVGLEVFDEARVGQVHLGGLDGDFAVGVGASVRGFSVTG